MSKRKLPEIKYEPYEGCRFCGGVKGCIGCKEEKNRVEKAARREQEAQEHLDKHLLFTAHYDNPQEMDILKAVFNRDALTEQFSDEDITHDDVLRFIGNGDVEKARRDVSIAAAMLCAMQPIEHDEAKRLVIAEARQKLVSQRAVERIRGKLAELTEPTP